jgi:integrase
MTRELNRLTPDFIRTVSPNPKSAGTDLYADGGNLYLQVTPSGAKSWLFRYAIGGHARSAGLGPTHTVSLQEAREQALRLRKLLREGKDPRLTLERERHAATAAQGRTFQAFAEEFIAGLRKVHKNGKAHAQWSATMIRYVYPFIGPTPIADIDVHMIIEILTHEQGWQRKNETMSRVRGRIERILGAAAVLGYRSSENPARFTNFLSEVLPRPRDVAQVRHHPSMPYQMVPDFMKLLRPNRHVSSYAALEFLTLTACRTSEVTGAKWSEIDFIEETWTIPACRMKSSRLHCVPLSTHALEILRHQQACSKGEYVFQGGREARPLSQMAMLQTMRGLHERKMLQVQAVPHGQRSSFRSWAAATTEFPRELAEAALAHVLEKVEKAYQRDPQVERRRKLMQAWGDYCYSVSSASHEAIDAWPTLVYDPIID